MNSDVELQPSVSDVLQEEPVENLTAIPVKVACVDTPVRTQELPRKAATSVTRTAVNTPFRILVANKYRASVRLVSFDTDMLVAFNSASKETPSTMSRWPKTVPLTITATTDIWISSYSVDGTPVSTSVSVITEQWAVGEN